MTLSLMIIIINVLLDAALASGLLLVMSRGAKVSDARAQRWRGRRSRR